MEKRKLKLALSIAAVVVVVCLIVTGVIFSFLSYNFSWNNRVDLVYIPDEAKLNFKGTVGTSRFVAQAENGEFDYNFWNIPDEETTFTQNRKKITITLEFTNLCNKRLVVTISGIHFDAKQRFDTYATDGSNLPIQLTKQPDGTGECQLYLEIYETTGSTATINLNYELTEETVRINGTSEDKQTLAIRVDLAS